ncbi:MAG: antibiotic biosynthesis monooxygenase [Leptospirales bacterium]
MEHGINEETKAHGDNVFVLVEEYYPKEGRSKDVLEIATESAKSIFGFDGLLMAKTLTPKKVDGAICNITTWESEEYFNSFMKSDALKELVKSPMMATVKEATSDIKVNMYQLALGWHQS